MNTPKTNNNMEPVMKKYLPPKKNPEPNVYLENTRTKWHHCYIVCLIAPSELRKYKILFSQKAEWNPVILSKRDKSGEHYVK